MSTSKSHKLELEQLLRVIKARGYQPLGMMFYDPKLKIVGIAQMEDVPDAFIEMLGKRLSGADSKPVWTEIN